MFHLTSSEKRRLVEAIQAAYTISFIDDIEDYIWEAIFAYAKGIPLVDPLSNIRSKNLFDVVDQKQKIGWSIKAIQKPIRLPHDYDLVIQRADIFTKADLLGFGELSMDSPTEVLGSALLKHWYDLKVENDAQVQNVVDKRVCILLKSKDRRDYVYLEEELAFYDASELNWRWTNKQRKGLQGSRVRDGKLVFRWYPSQKHFFEIFNFSADSYRFQIEPTRLATAEVVDLLLERLEGRH